MSEALADLLDRMPAETVDNFLGSCFREARVKPKRFAPGKAKLEWATQVAISGGIADIVLYVDDRPYLVIENKTWSGFRDHSTETESADQLTTYCAWLVAEAAAPDDCAILLVTGTTHAPAGFHSDGNYAVQARGQATWAAVRRWLRRETAAVENRATWSDLAIELANFIEEKRLSSEIYTQADVASISLTLPTMDRWASTFDTMWSSADDIRERFLNKKVSPLQFRVEGGMVWQWRKGQNDLTPGGSWLALGLRFPEVSEWYLEVGLPVTPHFVWIVGSDGSPLDYNGDVPEGWLKDGNDGEYLFAKPLHELSPASDVRVDQLREWSRLALAGAQRIMLASRLS